MKYWINFFWLETDLPKLRRIMPDTNAAQTSIFKGTTCWESLNRPFSNIPFSGRAALPEHRDWIYAQTAVLPLDMSFTISIIFLFAWSGLNQKNSTEIFICCLASAAPLLAWSLFTLGSLPRPLHADVCMTPIKAACGCYCPWLF